MKNKVLIIGPSISGNGGIASVIKSYTETNKLNNIIEIIASYEDGSKLKKMSAFIKGLNKCLYKLILDRNIKIVHIHSASRASFIRKRYFLKLSKLFNKKVIFHIHGAEFVDFYDESSERKKRNIRDTLVSADKVIALSSKWKEDLMKISNSNNIEVIYNPVVVDKFKRSSCNERKIVFMGRVGKRKGIYDLLEIMPKVASVYPDTRLYICGDGELDEVRRIIIENKLNDNVSLVGWTSGDEKIEIFNKSSIYILPSYNEGMPISILEAMSTGIPTIATNIAGIPEQIEHAKNGYLVNPGNKEALYNSIISLLDDEELRKKMGKSSLMKVKKYFDIHVIEDKILTLYRNIINM